MLIASKKDGPGVKSL